MDNSISLQWEMISNQEDDEPTAKMKITITNKGDVSIRDSQMAIFFNQPPRNIISQSKNTKAVISRVKGDLFKIQIKPNEHILPNETVELIYTMPHWIIKETDAPQGPYSVSYNESGNISSLKKITDYTIAPFTKSEQIDRHKNDNVPIPTAEWQYHKNQYLENIQSGNTLNLIPTPLEIKKGAKQIILSNKFILKGAKQLTNELSSLAAQLSKLTGTPFTITNNQETSSKQIELILDKNLDGNESYNLSISENLIIIKGADEAGVFYGIQSLLALIDIEYYKTPRAEISINEFTISDSPRFSYRGLHLDVCRNFQSKEEIIRILDLMAFYKLNKLHFYLTEDEGWRIEIKDLPELTSYGSKRGHTIDEKEHLMPAYGSGPFADDKTSHGSGYYTHADYIEILKHAKSKHIRIIPSINFPGHARAAVKSMEARYRFYMAKGDTLNANKYRLIDPNDTSKYQSVQSYNDNAVDVGLESTYSFFETVIDNIIEMYAEADAPLDIIHTGGDEVPNGVWTGSPASQTLLKSLPDINDTKNLQQYFFRRISQILTSKGLKTAGWEEVALTRNSEGEYVVNPEFNNRHVLPFVWNSFGESVNLTYKLANAGYPVVFCGVTNLYFDMAYNKDPMEPGYYWGGFIDEREAWELSPFHLTETITTDNLGNPVYLETKTKLKPESRQNIIGLQAQIWSETVKGPNMLEYYLLPRLISFAEKSWAKEPAWESMVLSEKREAEMNVAWYPFIERVADKELQRLNYINKGYNYRVPAPGAIVENELVYANHEYPHITIYYTTDGSEPSTNSLVYKEPIPIQELLKMKAIDGAGKESRTIKINKK